MSDGHTSKRWRSNALAALTILVMALVGPGLGLTLWVLGLALAPPWTFLTSIIYELLACVGLPLGMAAVWTKRLRMWGLLIVGSLAMLGFNDQNAQVLLAIPFGVAWMAVGYALWLGMGESAARPTLEA